LGAGTNEIDIIDKLHEIDDVAALVADAAIKHLFFSVDRKAIHAITTFRASTDPLDAAAQFDPAPLDLALDRNGAGLRNPTVKGGISHDWDPSAECWRRGWPSPPPSLCGFVFIVAKGNAVAEGIILRQRPRFGFFAGGSAETGVGFSTGGSSGLTTTLSC